MKKYLFLIAFLFYGSYSYSTSDNTYQDCNGAILRSNFKFSYKDVSYDLKDQFHDLSSCEPLFTQHLATQCSGHHMKNISLSALATIEKNKSLSFKKIVDENNKTRVFESGKESDLSDKKKHIIVKDNTFCSEDIQSIKNKYDNVMFETLCNKDETFVIKHFETLWSSKDLSDLEEKFLEVAPFKKLMKNYDTMLDGFLSCNHAKACNIKPALKESVTNTKEENINIDFMEEDSSYDDFESVQYIQKCLLCNLIIDVNSASKYEKSQTLLKEIKKIEGNLKSDRENYSGIMQRWCSEQKIIAFMLKNIGQYIPEETDIKAIFLMIHTYQMPCTCCRLSMVRLSKLISEMFSELKFHVVVSYRQDFDDRNSYVPAELKEDSEKVDDYLNNQGFKNALRPFDDTKSDKSNEPLRLEDIKDHSISMIKIEP